MTPDDVWNALLQHGAEIAATFLVGIILFAARKLWRSAKQLVSYFQRLNRAAASVDDERGLWASWPVKTVAPHPNSKVLVVANAKGGVGKTTVVANLAAAIAPKLAKPILLIDLDFQGSLSGMVISDRKLRTPAHGRSLASKLIAGHLAVEDLDAQRLPQGGNDTRLRVVPSAYDLAREENRVMVNWLIGDRSSDVRFTLRDLLNSPHLQQSYGLIILDCAPRLTTATVQSLAAGSHILIPSVLDGLSTEAVTNFVTQVETFRQAGVCPHIQYLGVLPTMLLPQANHEQAYYDLKDGLREGIAPKYAPPSVVPVLPSPIWANTTVRRAFGRGIAYTELGRNEAGRRVKESFDDLAQQTINRMGLAVTIASTLGAMDGQQSIRQGSSRLRQTEAVAQLRL